MSNSNDPWFTTTDSDLMFDRLYPIHGSGSQQKQTREQRQYIMSLARDQWRDLPGPARTTVRLAECIVDDEQLYLTRLQAVSDLTDRMTTEFDGSAEAIADWCSALRGLGFDSQLTPPRSRIDRKEWPDRITLVAYPLWPQSPNIRSIPKRWHRPDRLRDLYYHPARKTTIDVTAISESAVDLARQMALTGEVNLLGILADELEMRGCVDSDILDHCRNDRHRHGPGCWVVEQCLALIHAERKEWAENRFIDCLVGGDPTCRS